MCVDDEEMILLSLKDQLREHFSAEFKIEILESGEEALELVRDLLASATEIPVIICDQIMPGMKGNELLRELHSISPKTFNILLTGQADAGAVGDAVNSANLYRYIPKPWEETDLVLTIKEAVRGFYQDKKLEEQNRALKEMNENLETLVVERTSEVVEQKEEIQRQMLSIERQREELQVRNEFIRNVFGRYVSDEVMDAVLKNPEGLQIGGAKREISVLMSDLRGFTVLSEHLSAEEVVRILNRYLERMVEVIAEFSGIVIEFLGDGIMVIFGAPKRLANHAEHAIACALSMQNAITELNHLHDREGSPQLEMGIGISSGEVVVGNIGSERRTKYGVIGNAVNLAARIEGLSTGQQVLISSDTLDRCRVPIDVVRDFQVSVKGFDHPLRICEVSAIHESFEISFAPTLIEMQNVSKDVMLEISVLDGKSVSDTVMQCRLIAVSRQQAQLADCAKLQLRSDVRLIAMHVDGQRVVMEVYGKVTAVADTSVTLRFTSIFMGEAEAYYNALLGLKDGEGD
jgi:class 3 adenylate cyclase